MLISSESQPADHVLSSACDHTAGVPSLVPRLSPAWFLATYVTFDPHQKNPFQRSRMWLKVEWETAWERG